MYIIVMFALIVVGAWLTSFRYPEPKNPQNSSGSGAGRRHRLFLLVYGILG